MTLRLSIALTVTLALVGCGGGGSGSGQPTSPDPTTPPTNEPAAPPREAETHSGARIQEDNASLVWYANPQIDLPRHGRGGLQVQRPPHGGAAVAELQFSPIISDLLEPAWRYDTAAQERLVGSAILLQAVATRAYHQWTRHLNLDFNEPLTLQVGAEGRLNCGHSASGCYIGGDIDAVVLSDRFLLDVHRELWRTIAQSPDTQIIDVPAVQALFHLISHEAGHQFAYYNSGGIGRDPDDGCGGQHGCHAAYGSGSIMSYDHRIGRSVRYNVTEEDIRHVPNATWNDNDTDRYTVSRFGEPSSIDGWGVWIDHRFEVSGRTAPGYTSGGNPSLVDEIAGTGWVHGMPSDNVSLEGTATWSGEDNFLGVDFDPNYLGALLRADANLRYTFGARPNLNLRVNNFEAHYAISGVAMWHDHNFLDEGWGDFTYNMDCTSGGCSGDSAAAKWYPSDAGDPSGWVGGVVSDQDNAYGGSFVAEKD